MKKIVLSILMLSVVSLAFTPGKKDEGFEGKITYEIVYEELPEMLQPYEAMLPKEMVNYVKGSKVRVEQNTMGMMTVNVIDSEKKTGFMLMDQFGEKTAYMMEENDFQSGGDKTADLYDITYLEETKEIAGYKCTKVEMKHRTEGYTDYAWVTGDIKGSNKNYSFLKGFALEYSQHAPNEMVLVFKTKTLEKIKVDKSYFEVPKGYTKKPMADLQKQMEGMQGDK